MAVIERRPHDATSFTQGLEFDGDDLLESRGQYGQSALSRVDPADGTILEFNPAAEQIFADWLDSTAWRDRLIEAGSMQGVLEGYRP